ncbi:BAI1-associated protein 3 [Engraulis encrasicolus]|uniref:BAI1-associated protein 3 n=1 Tax=Engraulis encrasicolus TaxID=184585 RepID=UPI002FD26F52
MSTLLGLKSSVLRQVQRSQSLWERQEPPSPTCIPVAKAAEAITTNPAATTHRISDRKEFFVRMNEILLKQDRILDDGQGEHVLFPPVLEHPGPVFPISKASRQELDLLYEEAVYTILNQVGLPSPDHITSELDLFNYLQKVFDIGQEEHDIILQKVKESKRPSYALRVSVMKAKNLMAKDANGFSDPYCMLGLLIRQSPKEPEDRRERRFSFRKRREKLDKCGSSSKEVLSTQIQATEVKPETLNPVWNEHFIFDINDVCGEVLHLDIWDHDDDVSVVEACKKLNEISGIRGMGRYFKQIAKSVRANGSASSGSEENADDFLGCLNIHLSEIPVGGHNDWFKLEPRSTASKVQGDCHLIMRLLTSQRDTELSRTESSMNIHKKMLCQILDYEHSRAQVEPYNWNGKLSAPARTVICHHAMQADLSTLQQTIIHWECYSSHHRSQRMCYSSLLEFLQTIDMEWDYSAVHGDLEVLLIDSLRLHREYCLFLIENLHEVFPCAHPLAVNHCELMLRGLGFMQTMEIFHKVFPATHEIQLEMATSIKKGTMKWYDRMVAQYKNEEVALEEELHQLIKVVDHVCADVQRGQNIYSKLFQSTINVDFFNISYRQLERLVTEHVSVVMEKVSGTLEQETTRLTQAMGEALFELYISMKILKRFGEYLPLKDKKMLALNGFHNCFKSAIHKWLQIVHEQSCDRIHRAVEADQLVVIEAKGKHSSSAVDVTVCFSQVQGFWAQLAWPDTTGAFIFITRLTDNICNEAVYYSELLKRKIERSNQAQHPKSIIVEFCVALNNIAHVHAYLGGLPHELDWKCLEQAMEESCGDEGRSQATKALNGQLQNAVTELHRQSDHLIALLTEKMLYELRKYIQHISLSPDSIQNDDAVTPLMKYLSDMLVILSEALIKENLNRVLLALWELLLRLILDTVKDNRGVQIEFYARFQHTMELLLQFFNAGGEGIALEDLKTEDYKAVDEELRQNKCSSFELIEQYFLEKISQQRVLKHTKFGRISVKCYYDAPEQRLTVEILHGADLIALDTNGLSDPFVIVELCPHHLFPFAKSQRTQVKLKTLHPVFDELFYFHVSPEQYRHRYACITFTVMDYDWLSTNDFAGEAVAPLSDFCWPGRATATATGKTLQPVVLHLSRENPCEKHIIKLLDARKGDREAQEFVKRLKEIAKCMEEE